VGKAGRYSRTCHLLRLDGVVEPRVLGHLALQPVRVDVERVDVVALLLHRDVIAVVDRALEALRANQQQHRTRLRTPCAPQGVRARRASLVVAVEELLLVILLVVALRLDLV
jgi:hypothetical protein